MAGAARDRRDHRDLVAIGERRRGVGVVAVAREADRRAARRQHREARHERRPGRLDVGAVGQLEGTSRVPASSRWIANSRTRMRIATLGRGRQPSHEATSRPSPTGRIVALNRGSARTADIEGAQRGGVRVVRRDRPGARDPPAPQDVVGEDEGARREPARERRQVALVLGLERIDEGQVEGTGEGRLARRERVERGRGHDRDPLVGDARLAPPAAREVGPLRVRIDGHDRPVGGLAEGHPERRVAVRRADLDDPSPATGEDPQHAAGVARDDRDIERPCGGLDRRQRRRAAPAPAIRSSRGPRARGSRFRRPSPSQPHTSNPAPK